MSAKTARNWKKYPPAMRAQLRVVERNRAALLSALEKADVDITSLGYQRMAGAGNVVVARFKGMRKPVAFVTYKGLIEIARHLGIKWKARP